MFDSSPKKTDDEIRIFGGEISGRKRARMADLISLGYPEGSILMGAAFTTLWLAWRFEWYDSEDCELESKLFVPEN